MLRARTCGRPDDRKAFTPSEEVRISLSYCPRSSLPAPVLGWLAARLAHLTPPRRPGQGGTRPLSLEARLDAVAAFILDGLSTRVQRPAGWANQKVLYDAKRHAHTAQGLAVSTIHGDLLWVDGGWPGSCHEHELLKLAGLQGALDGVEVPSLLDRGFRGLAKPRAHWHAPVGPAALSTGAATPSGPTTACRRGCARWWSSRSASWQAPGRCAAGGGCCTGSGTSSGPPAR